MGRYSLPPEADPFFDAESWNNGRRHGYAEGHEAGEHLGEYALRDQLLRRLATMERDMKLGLLSNTATPLATVRAVALLIEDRRNEERSATMTDSQLLDGLAQHGLSREQLQHGLAVLETNRNGSIAWHFTHGQVQHVDLRLTYPNRAQALRQVEVLLTEVSDHGDNGLS
jgi:hypothetical protein